MLFLRRVGWVGFGKYGKFHTFFLNPSLITIIFIYKNNVLYVHFSKRFLKSFFGLKILNCMISQNCLIQHLILSYLSLLRHGFMISNNFSTEIQSGRVAFCELYLPRHCITLPTQTLLYPLATNQVNIALQPRSQAQNIEENIRNFTALLNIYLAFKRQIPW